MKYLFVSTLLLSFLFACKSRSTDAITQAGLPDSTKEEYFPVPELIQEDIKQVDSFAGGILLRRSRNNSKDSAYIQPSAFREMARVFLDPELDSASFARSFSETSLMDETTQQLNFIYTANRDSGTIKKVIVYVKPSLELDKISRIYMEKSYSLADTLVEQKLTWKINAYFLIATLRTVGDKALPLEIEKVIWNPALFEEE